MFLRLLLIVLSALLLAGCPGQWVKVEDRKLESEHYSLELPAHWIKVQLQGKWLVTRDGPSLQKIVIQGADHDSAFPTAKLESSPDLLASELAERYVADIKKEDEHGLPSFQIESNRPFVLGGKEGFRIKAKYRTEQGVDYELLGVGVASEKGFLSVTYTAPTLYYFERGEPQFEQLLTSIKLL